MINKIDLFKKIYTLYISHTIAKKISSKIKKPYKNKGQLEKSFDERF